MDCHPYQCERLIDLAEEVTIARFAAHRIDC